MKTNPDATAWPKPSATLSPMSPMTLLGGITPDQFLADYWQKKPLLVRGAVPDLENLITRDQLFALAADDDMQSRLVLQTGGWQMLHGPFTDRQLKRNKKLWTLLVQSVNLALPAGDALLRAFNFIPYARLDDLMVSYAVDGGGVGPHFDSYDVFLLQGIGQRRWRIGKQDDLTLIDDVPVRLLKTFQPSQEWVLEPGDLLYLPPDWAHDGVALGECMTLSVGFRAPPAQELADQFLTFLQDRLSLSGRYADADLIRQPHPAELGAAMIDQVTTLLSQIQWDRNTVRDFLGATLTEPKPQIVFDPPERPQSLARFSKSAVAQGIVLDPRSQLLFAGEHFFLNGEPWTIADTDITFLQRFADDRETGPLQPPNNVSTAMMALIHEAYCDGFIHLRP